MKAWTLSVITIAFPSVQFFAGSSYLTFAPLGLDVQHLLPSSSSLTFLVASVVGTNLALYAFNFPLITLLRVTPCPH